MCVCKYYDRLAEFETAIQKLVIDRIEIAFYN